MPWASVNTKAMMALLKKTAIREDFGEVLAEGGKFVAEKYGHPELFMGVKGMGMPAWHPQGVPHHRTSVCHQQCRRQPYQGHASFL